MLAVMKKLTYDEEYNFENEVRSCAPKKKVLILLFVCSKLVIYILVLEPFKPNQKKKKFSVF